MSKRLTVLPNGTQQVRDLTAAELAERAQWQAVDAPSRVRSEKQARLNELRRIILDAQAAGEAPDPSAVGEFKQLRTDLGA